VHEDEDGRARAGEVRRGKVDLGGAATAEDQARADAVTGADAGELRVGNVVDAVGDGADGGNHLELGVDDADGADEGDGDEKDVTGASTSRKEEKQEPTADGEGRWGVESPRGGHSDSNYEDRSRGHAAFLPGKEEEGRGDERGPENDRLRRAGQLYGLEHVENTRTAGGGVQVQKEGLGNWCKVGGEPVDYPQGFDTDLVVYLY